MMRNQQILNIILWVLILTSVLSTPLSWLAGKLYLLFAWGTNWIGDLVQMALS